MQRNCESGPSSDPVISHVEFGRNGLPDQRGQVVLVRSPRMATKPDGGSLSNARNCVQTSSAEAAELDITRTAKLSAACPILTPTPQAGGPLAPEESASYP